MSGYRTVCDITDTCAIFELKYFETRVFYRTGCDSPDMCDMPICAVTQMIRLFRYVVVILLHRGSSVAFFIEDVMEAMRIVDEAKALLLSREKK